MVSKPCRADPALCSQCRLSSLCFPKGLSPEETAALDELDKHRRIVAQDELLFRSGEPRHAMYAVRAGSVKCLGLTEDGRSQVAGFYLPSEIVGLDGADGEAHASEARTLEQSVVCEIPFMGIQEIARRCPRVGQRLVGALGEEVARQRRLNLALGSLNAEERVAGVLWGIGQRYGQLGWSDHRYRLSMSRAELGDYLGLALETVSRVLSRLQERGLVRIEAREVTILEPEGLAGLARHNPL